MRVLLQWIAAKTDPDDPAALSVADERGPTLQLLEADEYRGTFERAFFFADRRSIDKAEAMAQFLSETDGYPGAEAIELALTDPTDYAQLYNTMSAACGRILRELDSGASELFVHLSPGYPQAQTVWFILVRSGELHATLLQSVRSELARKLGVRPVREVPLALERFPEIRPPREETRPVAVGDGELQITGYWGNSPAVQECLENVRLAAQRSSMCVLIQGETGTGKELCARAIHDNSDRRKEPFVAVNCGALAEGLLESELFGHVKGAFTGAAADKIGRFQAANKGSIFLDEIGDASPALQVKLLRIIEQGEFERVGESSPTQVDVRVLAATNVDLGARLADGSFRPDLFYRLAAWEVRTHPLREHPEDIGGLCSYLQSRADWGLPEIMLSDACLGRMQSYGWPGNVRQLENVLQRLAVRSGGEEVTAGLVEQVLAEQRSVAGEPVSKTLEDVEREHCRKVLEETGGNKTKAADILGIDTGTLRRKIKE